MLFIQVFPPGTTVHPFHNPSGGLPAGPNA